MKDGLRILVLDPDVTSGQQVALTLDAAGLDPQTSAFESRALVEALKGFNPQLLWVRAELGSDALGRLLASDVSFQSDGGGKRPALPRVITGAEDVTGLLAALAKMFSKLPSELVRYTFINGLPGFVTEEADGLQTTALLIDGGRIRSIYVMRNPDKLRHLDAAIH